MKQLYSLFFALSIGFAQVPKVWWVDGASGNDNNNGQSEATAFKSIQNVFTNNFLSAYNDTIYVKEGTYDFKDAAVATRLGFVIVGGSGAEKPSLTLDQKTDTFLYSFTLMIIISRNLKESHL